MNEIFIDRGGVTFPAHVGDSITVNSETFQIKGIHLYIGLDNRITTYRFHIGNGKFITINPAKDNYEINRN